MLSMPRDPLINSRKNSTPAQGKIGRNRLRVLYQLAANVVGNSKSHKTNTARRKKQPITNTAQKVIGPLFARPQRRQKSKVMMPSLEKSEPRQIKTSGQPNFA